jgi:hypothetical protein
LHSAFHGLSGLSGYHDRLDRSSCMKLIWFIDRGYLQLAKQQAEHLRTNLIQIIESYDSCFLGTCKESSFFPMKVDLNRDTPLDKQSTTEKPVINAYGTRSAFTATQKAGTSLRSATVLRHGMGKKRCARVVTNAPEFQMNTWVYEVKYGLISNDPVEVHRLPHMCAPEPVPESSTCLQKSKHEFAVMESSIFKITREQRTPDWFLGRTFRCTSTSAHHVVNCSSAPYFTSEELVELHQRAKNTAQLNPNVAVVPLPLGSTDSTCVTKPSGAVIQASAVRGDKTRYQYWMNGKNRAEIQEILAEHMLADTAKQSTRKSMAETLADFYKKLQTNLQPVVTATSIVPEVEVVGDAAVEQEQLLGTTTTPQAVVGTATTPQAVVGTATTPQAIAEAVDVTVIEEITAQVIFLQRMVPNWFLKPFEAREGGPIDLGCENETRSVGQLGTFFRKHSQYKIIEIQEYGLLANRCVPFVATSPDAVCTLLKKDDVNSVSGLCVVEIKTISGPLALSDLTNRVHEHGKFLECTAGSSEFKCLVPNAAYRSQIVHHASVMGIEHCCIVFTSTLCIEQVIMVRVTSEQRADWLRLFQLLSEAHMQFVYGTSSPTCPPRIGKDYSVQYGYAREHHTLETYVHLWHQHNADVMLNGTPPTCRRLLPLQVTTWNKFMGGIDTVRKVACGQKVIRGRNSKPGTLLWMTLLDYVLYNAFRVYQYARMENKLDLFKTYRQFSTCRQQLDFRKFLSLLNEMTPDTLLKAFPVIEINCMQFRTAAFYQSSRTENEENKENEENGVSISAMQTATQLISTTFKYKALERFNTEPLKSLRLNRSKLHVMQTNTKKLRCIYCCFKCSLNVEHPHRFGRETMKICSECKVALCKYCFERFHRENVLEKTFCSGGDQVPLSPLNLSPTPSGPSSSGKKKRRSSEITIETIETIELPRKKEKK